MDGWLKIALAFLVMLIAPAHAEDFNCDDPQYQAEMNLCAFRDFEKADKELNEVWKVAKAWVENFEADLPRQYAGGSDKLLQAQRLWIKFRDAHCESVAHPSSSGSIYPLVYHSCRTNLTLERTKQLREIAEEG